MSILQHCSICSKLAISSCTCSSKAFLCAQHMPLHISSSGKHQIHPLRFLILPQDIQVLQNIQNTLLFLSQQKVQKILRTRKQMIRPLLQQIENLERSIEDDIKRILQEQQAKIQQIQEIVRTGELTGEKKNIFITRGNESLKDTAERVYLGQNWKTEILTVDFLEQKRKVEGKKRVQIGERIQTLRGHRNTVQSVAFSPNGEYLASASSDKTINIWRISNGKHIKTLTGHTNRVVSIIFSPNGEYLASGSWDKTIKLWSLSSQEPIKTLIGHRDTVRSVVFSPNGEYLASGSCDKTIFLWMVQRGEHIKTLFDHSHFVTSVVFSPYGEYLASGSWDKSIKIWRIQNGELINTLTGHSHYVTSVVFSSKESIWRLGLVIGLLVFGKCKAENALKLL